MPVKVLDTYRRPPSRGNLLVPGTFVYGHNDRDDHRAEIYVDLLTALFLVYDESYLASIPCESGYLHG